MRLTGWRRMLLAALAGVVLALGQAPFGFPYGAIIAIPLLLVMLRNACCWRGGFAIGWAAGVGYFGLTMTWIVEPFLVNAARHGWMAPLALILMAGGLALFWGFGFAMARRWLRGNGWDALILAGFWTATEVLRAYIFTGFPWALIGTGWVDTPLIQLAALIGVQGFGFALVLALGLLATRRGVLLSLVLLAGMYGFGAWRLSSDVANSELIVRLVQPNAEQHLKWDPEHIPQFYQRQLGFSAAGKTKPDVTIWPEAAIAYLPDEQQHVRAEIAAAAQAPVILGARRRDTNGVYNSLFLLSETGVIEGVYDKYHLVPFGEYIPFAKQLRQWGLAGLADQLGGNAANGSGPKVLEGAGLPPFLPLICYEAIFPRGLRVSARPDWLVQVTNDAWFGKWNGPFQHLAQARIRAIEQGLPLARAANTGVSAMVDPYGRITAQIDLGEAGYVDAPLPAPLTATLFSRTGQWPALWAILALLCWRLWRGSKHR